MDSWYFWPSLLNTLGSETGQRMTTNLTMNTNVSISQLIMNKHQQNPLGKNAHGTDNSTQALQGLETQHTFHDLFYIKQLELNLIN